MVHKLVVLVLIRVVVGTVRTLGLGDKLIFPDQPLGFFRLETLQRPHQGPVQDVLAVAVRGTARIERVEDVGVVLGHAEVQGAVEPGRVVAVSVADGLVDSVGEADVPG